MHNNEEVIIYALGNEIKAKLIKRYYLIDTERFVKCGTTSVSLLRYLR
jgi:hypothetical protein